MVAPHWLTSGCNLRFGPAELALLRSDALEVASGEGDVVPEDQV